MLYQNEIFAHYFALNIALNLYERVITKLYIPKKVFLNLLIQSWHNPFSSPLAEFYKYFVRLFGRRYKTAFRPKITINIVLLGSSFVSNPHFNLREKSVRVCRLGTIHIIPDQNPKFYHYQRILNFWSGIVENNSYSINRIITKAIT